MSVSNSQVAHAWAHGRSSKGSNFHTDGVKLTSYSTTVAVKIDDTFYISSNNMSPSTGKQLGYAKRAVSYVYFNTPAFGYGRRLEWAAMTHEAMIKPAAESAVKDLERALTDSKTRKTTKEKAVFAYIQDRQRIMEHAARVNVSIIMPEMAADPEAIAEYLESARKAAELKEAARIKAAKKQQKEYKKQLDIWLTTGAGTFPASFMVRGADQITIRDNKIVTSQGAECPLDHAIKALKFYESKRLTKEEAKNLPGAFLPYHTNGHKIPLGMFTLDEIREDGTAKAGCHAFTAKELQRFINQWREVLGL